MNNSTPAKEWSIYTDKDHKASISVALHTGDNGRKVIYVGH